jgi:hypothetical protein
MRPGFSVVCAVAILLAGCSGGGDSRSGSPGPPTGPSGSETPGPPSPVLVDESGVPATSDSRRMAFVNVTVVAMDSSERVAGQTVLVEDRRISEIGDAASVAVPPDAEVLDGEGRYLMPGLIDMHVHLLSDPGAVHDLTVVLAAGVTSVRVMWGMARHLEWRDAIAAGTLVGPTLYVASAGLDGSPPFWPGTIVVDSAERGRAAVRDVAGAGYDYVKVYSRLQLEPYVAILDEANRLGVRAVGHVPLALTADFAISSGQYTIEHFSRFASALTSTGDWSGEIDASKLAALAEQMRQAGTWNCPTLTVQTRSQDQVAQLRANPLFQLLSQPMREWLDSSQPQPPAGSSARADARRKEVLAALVGSGVRVVAGTDAGVFYVFPGFSLHEELRNLVDAGLSPYRALRAATVDAAASLEASDRGRIAAGQRADLLLLDSDPLADITHVNRRVGVMAGGRWFAQSALMEMARE